MTINRFNPSRDGNEKEIVKAFKSLGISVERLNTPLDLLLGWNKRNYLVEVKMPTKKLNANQLRFTGGWKGQFFICYSVDDALRFGKGIKSIKNKDIYNESEAIEKTNLF